MSAPSGRPTVLLVGGARGLVGRAVLAELARDHAIVSVHPHRAPNEEAAGVRWIRRDAREVRDWSEILEGIDEVVNLAWYRSGGRRRFRPLADALVALVREAEKAGVKRLLHVSVPAAPPTMEAALPYLTEKRRVDRAIEASSLDWAIVRPTMVFGPRDRLLTVMLRIMHRYRRFPMFGDGGYHLSPIASHDLARVVRRELAAGRRAVVEAGGPRRWRYRDLTDVMFARLGLEPRYTRLSAANSVRLARLMETVGLRTLYAYEVTWLLSDMLGLAPYAGLDPPLAPVEPFLEEEAGRLQGHLP